MRNLDKSWLGNRLKGTFSLSGNLIFTAIIFGVLVFFVENIAARALPVLDSGWDYFWAVIIMCVVVFCFIFYSYDKLRKQVAATAQTFDACTITDRPYLICGYSPVDDQKPGGPLNLDLSSFPKDLDEACRGNRKDTLGSWQQNLRVLRGITGITKLYVILPNKDQFDRFSEVIRHFCPNCELNRVTFNDNSPIYKRGYHDRGIAPDFENFEYVTAAINRAIEMISEKEKISKAEVEIKTMIDVTAGLKTFSIAAAIASLNRRLIFVYAATGDRVGSVIGFNASIRLFEEV